MDRALRVIVVAVTVVIVRMKIAVAVADDSLTVLGPVARLTRSQKRIGAFAMVSAMGVGRRTWAAANNFVATVAASVTTMFTREQERI